MFPKGGFVIEFRQFDSEVKVILKITRDSVCRVTTIPAYTIVLRTTTLFSKNPHSLSELIDFYDNQMLHILKNDRTLITLAQLLDTYIKCQKN